MSLKKMTISKRILFGYSIFFIIFLILGVYSVIKNVASLNDADTLVKNNDSDTYTQSALKSFLSSSIGAHIMIMSDDYNIERYNTTMAQIDESLSYLNEGIDLAVKEKMTQREQLFRNGVTDIENYKDMLVDLHEVNLKKAENKNKLPTLGRQSMDSLLGVIANENEVLKQEMSLGNPNLLEIYDRFYAFSDVKLEFYNARILSTRLSYLDDITAYEEIMTALESVKTSLQEYSAGIPESRQEIINAALSDLDIYMAVFTEHHDILSQVQGYTEMFNFLIDDVLSILQDASDMASAELENMVDNLFENNQSSLILVILAAVAALIINIYMAFIIMKSINKDLQSSIGELSDAAASVSATSKQLAGSSANLAQGSSEQAASIEETSATMTETTSMLNQNNQNTRQAVDLSKISEESASAGVQKVEKLINFMEDLNQSSDKINKIIETINTIASQTTILALNASVEAVRAGDAGKSFTVVAEEVRSLAQQTTAASESTTKIIKENINLSKESMENSKEVGDALKAILSDAGKVSHLLNEISIASEEQARGAKQINIALSQMEQVTQSAAAVSEESAAAANELQTQSETLQSITQRIQNLIGGGTR